MKTKLITMLAMAAALAFAGPAYAKDAHRGGGAKGHAVAAAHRGGGGAHVAAVSHARSGGARGRAIASRRTTAARPARAIAANRNVPRNNVASRNVARNNVARNNVTRSNVASSNATRNNVATSNNGARNNFASRNSGRNSVAFGGSGNNGRGNYQYAFASHNGWDHGQEYFWQGHHYHWYNNGWFIIDPYPGYYGSNYNYGGSAAASVQAALSQQGYYNGPADGVIGPRTRAAIAAYQQDNGLPVTGTITPGLLNTLGVG